MSSEKWTEHLSSPRTRPVMSSLQVLKAWVWALPIQKIFLREQPILEERRVSTAKEIFWHPDCRKNRLKNTSSTGGNIRSKSSQLAYQLAGFTPRRSLLVLCSFLVRMASSRSQLACPTLGSGFSRNWIFRLHCIVREQSKREGYELEGDVVETLAIESKLELVNRVRGTPTCFVDLTGGFGQLAYTIAKRWPATRVYTYGSSQIFVEYSQGLRKKIAKKLSIPDRSRIKWRWERGRLPSNTSHVFLCAENMPAEELGFLLVGVAACETIRQLFLVLSANQSRIQSLFPDAQIASIPVQLGRKLNKHLLWIINLRNFESSGEQKSQSTPSAMLPSSIEPMSSEFPLSDNLCETCSGFPD